MSDDDGKKPIKPELIPSQISDQIPVPEALKVAYYNFTLHYEELINLIESIPQNSWARRHWNWRHVVRPRFEKAVEHLSGAIRDHVSKQESLIYHAENISEAIRQLGDAIHTSNNHLKSLNELVLKSSENHRENFSNILQTSSNLINGQTAIFKVLLRLNGGEEPE